VFKADFSDHKAFVEAFRGKDVVLVSTGDFYNAAAIAIPLIDAAIEAGVTRFIPSGWGLCVNFPVPFILPLIFYNAEISILGLAAGKRS
jgi:hypothetical protein